MRHIRKYWTFERCQEEALKFNSVTEFKNGSAAYSAAYRNDWMDEICSHMIRTQKPNGYWTKEKCQEDSLKYNNRSNFQKNSYVAYDKAYKNGWLDDICSHMTEIYKPKGYWTYEKCKEKALEYKTKYDFYVNNYGAYGRAYRNGWLDDICSHMIIQNNNTKRCIYCYEFEDNSVYIGLTYDIEKRQKNRNISDFDQVIIHIKKTGLTPIRKQLTDYIGVNDAIKLEGYYVEKYKNEGWNVLNKSKTGAIGGSLRWTYEKCKEEALKYKSRYEFVKTSKGAYESSAKHKWLDDVCSHMIPTQKPTGYWSYKNCKEEALKYKTRTEFQNNASGAYNSSLKHNWLDEICSHMVRTQKWMVK